MKAEKSEKEMTEKSGSTRGSVSDPTASAPPPSLYPDLHSVRPPPYIPNQDLQQVQVTVKETALEVEMAELDMMKEQIKLLTARLDGATGPDPQERSGTRQSERFHQAEGTNEGELESREGSQDEGDEESENESEDEGREGLRIVIKGTMNVDVDGEVTFPIAERTRDREDKKSIAQVAIRLSQS